MNAKKNTSSTISARSLAVKKGDKYILRSLSFQVEPGTIIGLLGPSGSGKTTLMRAVVGVQKISNGSLKVLGKPAGDKSIRRSIGYVTQVAAVYEDLTVMQNLKYFATIARANRGQLEQTLHHVGLEDYKNQLVSTLSGGQKTRVSLAVALLGNPDILVLDEPTVGLDPVLRRDLWQLFSELAKRGKTLFISSHVMDEAEHCDQILLLRDGHLLWKESTKKLLSSTKQTDVESAFLAVVEGEK